MAAHDESVAKWFDPNARFAELSRYADFMRHDDGTDSSGPARFPLILELAEGDAAQALKDVLQRVPAPYKASPTRYITAELDEAQYLELLAGRHDALILRWELQLPVIPLRPQSPKPEAFGVLGGPFLGLGGAGGPAFASASTPAATDSPDAAMQKARRWLLGVIDTGCPFAHASLWSEAVGTRILRLWDQDTYPALGPVGGNVPADFGFGRQVSRSALNAWMAVHRTPSGRVDEDSCYLNAGYGMVAAAFGHGAAILSILAAPRRLEARYPTDRGDVDEPPTWRPAGDAASEADIVFVQMPRDVVQDSSSAAMARSLLDGLRYIVSAKGDATERIVVNISDGTSRHLHDGSSIIEQAIADLVREVADARDGCSLDVVIAAGNSFDALRHAHLRPTLVQEGGAVTHPRNQGAGRDLGSSVWLRIPPDCESPQFLSLRVPRCVTDVRFTVTPPGGAGPIELSPGRSGVAWPSEAQASCWLVLQDPGEGCASEGLIVWAPTGLLSPEPRSRGVVGDWRIDCRCGSRGEDADVDDVHLWISLNQSNDGAVAPGRQARFLDSDRRYDSEVYLRAAEEDGPPPVSAIQRMGTLSGLATNGDGTPGVWIVGSRLMRVAQGRRFVSAYSSAGPSADGGRARVDGWRPTDFTRWSDGIRVGGTRSGQVLLARGTSFATAQWIRDLLNLEPGQRPWDGDPQTQGCAAA